MPELNLDLLKERKKVSSKVRPYDFDIPVPKKKKVEVVDDKVHDTPLVKSKVLSEPSEIKKEVAPQEKKITSENTKKKKVQKGESVKRDTFSIDLSESEVKELKSLSKDRINELDSRTKSAIRLLLSSNIDSSKDELNISYHAQILLDVIKRNLFGDSSEVLFSYDDIESFGLRRKYIKKSYEELVSEGLIEVSQVINEGKIKNKYKVLN